MKEPSTLPLLPGTFLPEVFPFYFHWNADMTLRALGPSLTKIFPDAQLGQPMAELFRLVSPAGSWEISRFQGGPSVVYLFEIPALGLKLRGQILELHEPASFLMLASPWISNIEDIARLGLSIDDFAPHDQTMDLLQMVLSYRISIDDLKKLADSLTEQRARMHAQQAEARKLALVAARTDNAVVVTDAEGRIEWVNDGFTRITGWKLDEVIKKRPGSFLQGPDTDPETIALIHNKLIHAEPVTAQILNYSKNGRKYWVDLEIQPIHDEDGRLINFMAIESDITSQRESERQLRETAALQHAMLQSAGYAIIAADTTGIIRLFNPAAERLLGYTASELIGLVTPGVFHDPDEVAEYSRQLSHELGFPVEPGFETFVAKARRGRIDQREWTYIRKDGVRIPVLLSVTALTDDQQITGFLGLATNLTEMKKAEERVRNTLSELERLNRVMMNREERVLELKQEINELCQIHGLAPKYPSALD
ncbi:PAS domain S-box-containing protein [Haloferula luteola]|uniref:guanylate cyclase n=1 Tax=Haloferula luteola TaxID=595692 RepID=A0A840VAR3_9BACT|nr:PAS domain S-box protein [Haloferula luteola]MBB5350889.1 PAS domain S-box-containing protein [Haloferula luteola]